MRPFLREVKHHLLVDPPKRGFMMLSEWHIRDLRGKVITVSAISDAYYDLARSNQGQKNAEFHL